ncbi:MAG: Fic family protein [Elusimicrobiota bacterium]
MTVSYQPKFERSAAVLRNITEASSLRAWIEQQAIDVSWIARGQRDALVRLAHYSTRIEGNPLTLPEVEALAAGKDLPVGERAKREVLNYFAALRWIWRESSAHRVDEKDLLHLHAILTQGLLPKDEAGCYKTKPNAVFGRGRILYKPPPPEAAAILTQALLRWLDSGGAKAEHPVISAAIAHHRLVSIHPFMDGNGRMARALESWILYRRGFDTHHIFALDEYFDTEREKYYREIQTVRGQEDDLTPWLEYVSEGVLETLRKTRIRIQSLRAKGPAVKITLNLKQERIVQILSQSMPLGGGDLARSLGVSRSHLSKLLKPLIKAGLILRDGSTKAAAYRLS